MTDKSDDGPRRTHEQYSFYVVALAFTMLGLAVQTTKIQGHTWTTYLELAGWIVLFVGAVAALLNAQQIPHGYIIENTLSSLKEQGARLSRLLRGAMKEPSAEHLAEVHARQAEVEKESKATHKKRERYQLLHRILELVVLVAVPAGVILIGVARAGIALKAEQPQAREYKGHHAPRAERHHVTHPSRVHSGKSAPEMVVPEKKGVSHHLAKEIIDDHIPKKLE